MAPKIGTRKDGTPRTPRTPRGRRPLDDLEIERIRQRLDEVGSRTPNYGAPLSAKHRRAARRRRSVA